MTLISMFRLVALGLALLFGLVILGLTAHWTQGTLITRLLYDFEIVALLAGALSAIALPTFLVVGLIRKHAIISKIYVELPILGVLWILWLVNAALVAQWAVVFYPFGCGDFFNAADKDWCHEFLAIEGLSFVTWIILFLYTAVLLVFCLIGQSRGHIVWSATVSEAIFFDRPNQTPATTYDTPSDKNFYPVLATPVQQYQYPPNGVPMMQPNVAAVGQYGVPSGGAAPQSGYPQV